MTNKQFAILLTVAILIILTAAVAVPAPSTKSVPVDNGDCFKMIEQMDVSRNKIGNAEWFPKKENVDDKGIVVLRFKF